MVGRICSGEMLGVTLDQRRSERRVALQDRSRLELQSVSEGNNQLAREDVDRSVDLWNRVGTSNFLKLFFVSYLPPAGLLHLQSDRR